MAFLTVNGGTLHVLELSPEKGDPIVMTHGMFMSLAALLFTIASPLAKQHRVILYDLRGHGRSDRRDEGYTPALLSEDLLGIMDALSIPQAHLVAYSYGGTAALYTALHHPERVGKLALLEAMFINKAAYETLPGGDDAIIRLNRGIDSYTEATGIPVTGPQAERMRSLALHILEQKRRKAMFRANNELIEEVTRGQLMVPTLLMYGDSSPYLDRGEMLASSIPTAQFCTAEGDHNLFAQQSELIACRLRDFLGPAREARERA
jgi:pimeloyl-ACP methyl ester carboxylesterase